MKKLILFLSAILLACFVFTSCTSSIMKRHYRKGYFVEHKKRNVNPEQIAKKSQADASTQVLPAVKEEVVLASTDVIPQSDPVRENAPEAAKKNKLTTKQVESHESIAKSPKNEPGSHKSEITRQSTRGIAAAVKGPDAEIVGAALSLMWVLILIILVIYIIGLLAIADLASSGWIHILGVVVVVLLILWLLRII